MKLLDLFSGIGGFHLGLERAGFEFEQVYFSEIDQHAIANYKYNFKKSNYVGDVKSISTSGIRRPNIITFGSPCQDFSLAGKRRGLDGERSSLIEYALRAISKFRPDVFIWENVKGAFSSNNSQDFWAIIQAFANIGGYRLEWQLLNTSWVLPQNRERIYLVGHLTESFPSWQPIFPFTENDFDLKETYKSNNSKFQTQISNCLNSKGCNRESDAYIVSRVSSCLTGGGNSGGLHSDMDVVIDLKSCKSTTRGGMLKYNNTHTLDTDCLIGISAEESVRRLTEIECERLQGFPDNWTKYGDYGEVKEIAKTNRYKLIGNAVTVDVVKLVAERIKINYANNPNKNNN